MTVRYRIPITAITVFGASSLLALSVGIVLYLGFNQAAESTRKLWADQSKTLIDTIEQSLDAQLRPIRDQAKWVAQDVRDLSSPEELDDYMYGVLAATPQVAGIAVITPQGFSRRWHRGERVAIDEDWSQRDWFRDYRQLVESENQPAWREPIFTDTVNSSTLLHDVPLRDEDGQFIGIFAQIVPVEVLSSFIATQYSDTGTTPFVLYDRNFVLAHPRITNGDMSNPLPRLDELNDLILRRIWTPDEKVPYIQSALKDTKTVGVFWGDDDYLFLYRDIESFGPASWTVGAYLNTSLLEERPGQRIIRTLAFGIAILVLAVIAAVVIGRRISTPVKALVQSAALVETGQLDRVEPLGQSRIREFDEAGSAFNNMVNGLRERQLIRDTLGRFVPEEVASSLLAGGGKIDVQQTEATILFCDVEAFTRMTESLGPVRIVEVLNAYFSAMVDLLEAHGGVVTQFQGDAILATFNVPITDPEHARNAVLAGREMLDCVEQNRFAGERLNVRIGINTGPVIAGAIGARGRLNYTVHGDAVNLAARLEALNKEYGTRLMISESSAAAIDDIELSRVGEVTARGQTRSINIYTIESVGAKH